MWPQDFQRVCLVRKPTTFVAEQGASIFLGSQLKLDADEALQRSVDARLGSAFRDNATIFLATQPQVEDEPVVGTVDCVKMAAGKGRRAFDTPMPPRVLIRNLWVEPAFRRKGIGRALLRKAEAWAREQELSMLVLEVVATNDVALELYASYGFEEVDALPGFVPRWARGSCLLRKPVDVQNVPETFREWSG